MRRHFVTLAWERRTPRRPHISAAARQRTANTVETMRTETSFGRPQELLNREPKPPFEKWGLAMTRNEESKGREVAGLDFYEMSETLSLIESLLLQTWYVSCPFRKALVAKDECHCAASSLESPQHQRVHMTMYIEKRRVGAMPIDHQENLPLACSRIPNLPTAERIGRAEPAERIPVTILLPQPCGTPPLSIPKHLRQADFRAAVAAGVELIGAGQMSCKSCAVEDSIRCQNQHCTERRTHHGDSN
jgi:hypothetical protein